MMSLPTLDPELITRLTIVETKLDRVIAHLEKINGRLTEVERNAFLSDAKIGVQASQSLHHLRDSDSTEDWLNQLDRDLRKLQCDACEPEWRKNVNTKLEDLSAFVSKLRGGWVVIGIAAVILMQGVTVAIALLKR